MKYLRNPEVRKEVFIAILLDIFLVMGAGYILKMEGALFVAGAATLLIVLHFLSSYIRYEKLRHLSEEVDRFLHGYEAIGITDEEEGELSILRSEISKMIIRMKNQTARLMDERKYLSDSIADISHQVRTPLTSVNLLVSRLSVENLTKEKRFLLIRELEGRLSHIDWLIQALLRMSKLDAETVQMAKDSVSVVKLIQNSTVSLEIPMELRGQTLQVQCQADVQFLGDMSWSVEALSNVVKNCMEHTPEGGKVMISALENALYTEIIVEDTGSGIDSEDLPHLFERFYKGKNSSDQSVGIGLALSRMIWMAQNGTIEAVNRKEGGARFSIRIYKVTI